MAAGQRDATARPEAEKRKMNELAEDPRNRRLVRVAITFELLTILITQGDKPKDHLWLTTTCTTGLPEGSVLMRTYVDDEAQCAYGVYFHESFEPVPMGDVIPILIPVFRHETSVELFEGLKLELHGTQRLVIHRDRTVVAREARIRAGHEDDPPEDCFYVRTKSIRDQVGITRDVIKHYGPRGLIEILGYEGQETITDGNNMAENH